MKVPINWLKEYIDFTNEKELVDKLTAIGHMQDGPPVDVAGTKVYDLEVRQNRPDCLSLVGIAREAAAVLNKKVKHPEVKDYSKVEGETKVEIKDPSLCYRVNTATIEGISVKDSPEWLKDKLTAYGIKTVNNVVDITNFVMVETGQPLHAFDKEKIEKSTLIVRTAKEGEKLALLGDAKVTLTKNDLVFTDPSKAVALAGVMGGKETGVTDKTKSIILEATTYNQASVRRTSIRHQVRTEASTRLEKFTHPKLTEIALKRTVALVLELCGGKITDTTDVYPTKKEDVTVKLTIEQLNKLGGVTFSSQQARTILQRLELETSDSLTVKIPYFRTDLEIEEDLIEEVLRIHGYDKLIPALPSSPPPKNIDLKEFILEEKLKDLLTRAGLDEQITEPLTNEADSTLKPVLLENSLNTDKTMLRTTLKNGLLKSLQNQVKHRKQKVMLFETGKIFYLKSDKYVEQAVLGIITKGVDYFETKGLIDLLKEHFELKQVSVTIDVIDSAQNIYFFELPVDKITADKIKKPLTSHPQVIFQDISLFVPKNTKVGDLVNEARSSSDLISRVELGEEPKASGDHKSVFLHLQFESSSGNITKDVVDKEKKAVLKLLEEKFSAKVR